MNKEISDLWESKGFRTAVKVMNICLIAWLIYYLVFVIATRTEVSNGINKTSELSVSGKEYIEVETEIGDAVASDQMVGVFYVLLQGSHVELS